MISAIMSQVITNTVITNMMRQNWFSVSPFNATCEQPTVDINNVFEGILKELILDFKRWEWWLRHRPHQFLVHLAQEK